MLWIVSMSRKKAVKKTNLRTKKWMRFAPVQVKVQLTPRKTVLYGLKAIQNHQRRVGLLQETCLSKPGPGNQAIRSK